MSSAKSWPFCLGLNVLRGNYIWMLFWMDKMYICLIQLGTEWVTSLTPKGRHIGNLLDTGYTDVVIMFFFVCFITKSFLTYLFYLHLLYQPCVGPCQATRVQSHQRQSTSAVATATCEVQVSVADYQTVPTVATGVSKPLCCRLTLTFYTDQWEPIVIYHSITLTGRYTTMQPTLLTSWLQLLSYKV